MDQAGSTRVPFEYQKTFYNANVLYTRLHLLMCETLFIWYDASGYVVHSSRTLPHKLGNAIVRAKYSHQVIAPSQIRQNLKEHLRSSGSERILAHQWIRCPEVFELRSLTPIDGAFLSYISFCKPVSPLFSSVETSSDVWKSSSSAPRQPNRP